MLPVGKDNLTPGPGEDDEHHDAQGSRRERYEMRDGGAKGDALVYANEFNGESQGASADEVPAEDDQVARAAPPPPYKQPSETAEAESFI